MEIVKRHFIILLLVGVQFSAFSQRGDGFRHVLSIDVAGAVQGVGNIKYEFFDAPRKGIALHVLADLTDNEIPVSGIISRRFYFSDSRWSAFVAPYASYMYVGGTYIPQVENEEGEIVKGSESRYTSRSTNIGMSIGYNYLGMGGLAASAEFGYGYAIMFDADWLGEPPTSTTESTLKAVVPLIFNITVGYAF